MRRKRTRRDGGKHGECFSLLPRDEGASSVVEEPKLQRFLIFTASQDCYFRDRARERMRMALWRAWRSDDFVPWMMLCDLTVHLAQYLAGGRGCIYECDHDGHEEY